MNMKHTRRTLRITSFVTGVLALSLLFIPNLVSAQTGSIGGRPAKPNPNNQRTQSIFVHELQPGAVKEDAIEVVNNTDTTKEVEIYSVDSVPSSGGAFACAQAAESSTNVGSWIQISASSATLQAKEKKIVPFTITVPNSAETGEQNGCIVLQEKKSPTFQGGIGLNFRTAIRVAILVPGEINKSIRAESLGVQQNGKFVIISPVVKNVGNVSLDTEVTTRLQTVLGTATTQINTFPVLRDQLTSWNFEFKKPFWGGFYKAGYSLSYDQSQKGYIGSPKSQPQTIDGQNKWFFVVPHPAALLLYAAIIIGAVVVVISLRKKKKQHHAVQVSWATYSVGKNETLVEIAKKHNVSWKKLATVNKLKAPYHLSVGQTLKVPPSSPVSDNSKNHL